MKKITQNLSTKITKGLICLLIFTIISISGFSQNAGISPTGAVPPNSSAGLDVNFTSQGLLIPRIALTGTSSFAPLSGNVAGMLVYNTATAGDVNPGFYFNDGTKWVTSIPKAGTAGDMQYWNGTAWNTISVGQPGQLMQLNSSGVPTWNGAGFASLTTTPVTGITATSAVSGGSISSDGGNAVTAYGVCWATTTNPTIANNKTTDGSGVGNFSSSITGLTTGTNYYVRAYATNSAGTSYGNQLSFMTP